MTCVHLRQLIELCGDNELKFSSRDIVHLVCTQCEKEEVCPSGLLDDLDEGATPTGDDSQEVESQDPSESE